MSCKRTRRVINQIFKSDNMVIMEKQSYKKTSEVVYIPRGMLRSKAFIKLSGKSLKIFLIFLSRRDMRKIPKGKGKGNKEWVCINNGEITLYYSEAEKKYGISRKTFSRIIDELVTLGFIDVARQGIGVAKVPTLYSISDRWRKFGTTEFEVKKRNKKIAYNGTKVWRKNKEKDFLSVKNDTCQVSEMTLISNLA